MMQDLFEYNNAFAKTYEEAIGDYEFVDSIPKEALYIRLNPDVSDD